MNIKKTLAALVVSVLLFGSGFFLYTQSQPATPVAAADETTITETTTQFNSPAAQTDVAAVAAEGQVLPLRDVTLSFQVGGRVAEVLVEEGAQVAADEPLLRLEADELEVNLQQAEAGVQSAQANLESAQAQLALAQKKIETAEAGLSVAQAQLALVEAGPRPEEVAAAESNLAAAEAGIVEASNRRDSQLNISQADIKQAEADLAEQVANLDSVQEQYDTIIETCFTTPDGEEVCPLYGTVEEATRFELQIAELQYDAAQAALTALREGPTSAQQQAANANVGLAVGQRNLAQAQLDRLLAGATDEQIQEAEVAVEQAELAIAQAEVGLQQAEAAVSQAEASLVRAQATQDSAQKALERMTLEAPFAGTIGTVNAEVGEFVGSGTPVVSLADISGWQVETTDLTELDVVAVEVGSTVDVRIDAIPDEVLTGTVTDIALVSTLTRGDVTYAVNVRLDDVSDLPLRWGMTAFVDVGG